MESEIDANQVAEIAEEHIAAGGDWGNLDKTAVPEELRDGWRHRHAFGEKRVRELETQGWEIEPNYKSQLEGHTLMRLPVDGPRGGRARDNWIERRNRLNERSVDLEEQAAKISAQTGAEVFVPKKVLERTEHEGE